MKKIFLFSLIVISVCSAFEFEVSNVTEFREALEDASVNGENDTIILNKGIYRTTIDDLGSFKFNDEEEQNLTIKSRDGLSYKDVILDGNNTNVVLIFNNNKSSVLNLERITITRAKDNGIDSSNSININECNISNNDGRGFYSGGSVKVTNSIISHNKKKKWGGGGFYARGDVEVINSKIYSNISEDDALKGGGGFHAEGNVFIKDSNLSNNITDSNGGGFKSRKKATVINCIIKENKSEGYGSGGGFFSYDFFIQNSILLNNSAYTGGGFEGSSGIVDKTIFSNNTYRYGYGGGFGAYTKLIVTNSFFINNSSIFYFRGTGGDKAYIINNTFVHNKGAIFAKEEGIYINNILIISLIFT